MAGRQRICGRVNWTERLGTRRLTPHFSTIRYITSDQGGGGVSSLLRPVSAVELKQTTEKVTVA